jgi:hypothetical protein
MPLRDGDWDTIDDSGNSLPAPIKAGVYKVKIANVNDQRLTSSGDPMWSLRLEVVDGDDKGHVIWDNLVFNKGGMGRVKMLYKQLGYVTEGPFKELKPDDLLRGVLFCNVILREYQGQFQNAISYDGYHTKYNASWVEPQKAAADTTDSDMPF